MRHAFMTTFWLSVPVLAAGFVIGILVSLAQILTSIQDSSFSTVPRLTVFLLTLPLTIVGVTETLFDLRGRMAKNGPPTSHGPPTNQPETDI